MPNFDVQHAIATQSASVRCPALANRDGDSAVSVHKQERCVIRVSFMSNGRAFTI